MSDKLTCIAAPAPPPLVPCSEQSLSHLREQYNALQSSLAGEASKASLLATQLSSAEAQNRSLQGSVTALEGERSRAQSSIASANEKVARWEVRVREVEGEVESRKVESRNLKVTSTCATGGRAEGLPLTDWPSI
jgi:septal ring factor EnvC (AmiA/AmiB activator)